MSIPYVPFGLYLKVKVYRAKEIKIRMDSYEGGREEWW